MKLQTYLMAQPTVQRYGTLYHAPLIKYEHFVPTRYFDGWIATHPTEEEIAFYQIGVQNQHWAEMPYVLSTLDRYHGYEIAVVEGILTPSYWEQWSIDNAAALLDERKNFVNGRDG